MNMNEIAELIFFKEIGKTDLKNLELIISETNSPFW